MVAQLAAAFLVCAASFAVQGRQAQKIYRVGFVTTGSPGSGLELLNLKAAKALGLTILQSLIVRADELID